MLLATRYAHNGHHELETATSIKCLHDDDGAGRNVDAIFREFSEPLRQIRFKNGSRAENVEP